MSRKATVNLSKMLRMDQLAFPLFLIFIAALFPYAVGLQGLECRSELQCAECDVRADNKQYCTMCAEHFGLFNDSQDFNITKCAACGVNCSFCNHIGEKCERCYENHGPNSGNLTGSCGPCTKIDNCTSGCNDYGVGHCDSCHAGFLLTNNRTVCSPCGPYCSSCPTNITFCDVCLASYYFYPNRTCGPCADHCNVAKCQRNGAGKCDTCDPGYGLTSEFTCALCASNCTTFGCGGNGAMKCDRCDLGFNLTLNNTCAPICSPNCNMSLGCNSSYTCTKCNFGYGLDRNGTCKECAPNCTTYGCTANGTGKCDRCDLGFNLTLNNTCSPICSPNCNLSVGCNFSYTCIKCNIGYGLDRNGTCKECAPNCTANGCGANGAMKCDRCDLGFNLTLNNTCTPICSPNCNLSVGCNSSYTCITCNFGFGRKDPNGTCDESPQNTTSPPAADFPPADEVDWRILLTLLMLILGGIFVTLVSLLYWTARFYPSNRRRIYLVKES